MFENAEQARRQLMKNKETILGGYVTEYIYEKQFLAENPDTYTSGWWFAKTGSQQFFFVVKEDLNNADRRVLARLRGKYTCLKAYPQGNVWKFTDMTLGQDAVSTMDEEAFRKKYELIEKGNGHKTANQDYQSENDPEGRRRKEKCLKFFTENSLLVPIAIQRNFADDVLEKYFRSVVNIDYFTVDARGNVQVEEVKYKNEAKSGRFGLNTGQAMVCEMLSEQGFTIHYSILYKKWRGLTVFEFMARQSEDRYWLESTMDKFSGYERHSAPKETSVYGNRIQRYIEFEKENFNRVPLRHELFKDIFSEKVYVASYDKYGYYHRLRNCEKIRDTDDKKIIVYGSAEVAGQNGYGKPCKYCTLQ